MRPAEAPADEGLAAHALPPEAVLAALGAGPAGLSESRARTLLARLGPNELPRAPGPSALRVGLRQFESPLIYLLAAAAGVSLAVGDPSDAGFIAAVLLLNGAIGGVQEWRAERVAQALQRLLRVKAVVERDGRARELDAAGLVAGDVVILESGNRVPADARLLEARSLQVDESLLTGESVPVSKDAAALLPETAALADRRNMAHAGTIVARGRGRAVVTATGGRTALGRVAASAQSGRAGTPPLLLRMERFSRGVGAATVAACATAGLLGYALSAGTASEMFLFSVALAVSAIPEGLPVALTVALAVAVKRMARRGVIVRRLAAVEGLGSCTMIASDKTGTLTRNELTVREARLPGGTAVTVGTESPEARGGLAAAPGLRPQLERAALCAVLSSEAQLRRLDGAWEKQGDPTEVALLAFGLKLGIERDAALERLPELERIPFEPERRFSASFHRGAGGTVVFVKGAPEKVFSLCRRAPAPALARAVAELAGRGMRVLALASGALGREMRPGEIPPEPSGLEPLGLVGLIDPPRPGSRRAIEACRRAGVAVAMITGDHPDTALAVARELGLADSGAEVAAGPELAGLSDAQLSALCARVRVFARTDPEQKLRLVRAMQEAGHLVAVTGDGVNDAPALRAANIGVAMGRGGTDVARESAEIVLTDDDFASIVAGVEEGRVAYANVRKVVWLLMGPALGEVVLMALALGAGLPLPLHPVQLLWLNLATNGIQDVALAFDPKEDDVLSRPPRPPRERVFDARMIGQTLVSGLVIALVCFAAYRHALSRGLGLAAARNELLLLLVVFENMHVVNCRSETRSGLRIPPWTNPFLLIGTSCALGLHALMMHLPAGRAVLHTAPVSAGVWARTFALAATVVLAVEAWKRLSRRLPP